MKAAVEFSSRGMKLLAQFQDGMKTGSGPILEKGEVTS